MHLLRKVFCVLFVIGSFTTPKVFAQKKKYFLIVESDISAPASISNKAFRKDFGGTVNLSGTTLLSTPNGKRNIGIGYQFTNFKAGLNANNINGNQSVLLQFYNYNLSIGNVFYQDYMFRVQGFAKMGYNFLFAKDVIVPAGKIFKASKRNFYSVNPGVDVFIKAQNNIFVGLRVSYNYSLFKYNPNDYFLNEDNKYSNSDFNSKASFLNLGLSIRFEFNKNSEE